MDQQQLNEILTKHSLWLNDDRGGERANLVDADLVDAKLLNANLVGADLRDANLRCANLVDADLGSANLRYANLRDANLRNANLRDANLLNANLVGADLRDANLRCAKLLNANLVGADLRDANLPHFQIVPETGSFYAYKKTTTGVIKIQIPSKARRTSSLVGRKCRAEYVEVVSGDGCGGSSPTHGDLVYNKGDIVMADSYDDDIRVECTNGIHFYMTKQEAEEH